MGKWLGILMVLVVTSAHARDGLELEIALKTPTQIEPGAEVNITARLVNRSAVPVDVVKPGDGSEVGWREPWIFYAATRTAPDGTTHEVPSSMWGRCGLFDQDWVKDIVTLAPGEALDVHTWIPEPSRALALDEPGTVTVRMHYTYLSTKSSRTPAPVGPHRMSGVSAFEVVSNPLTITIATPLTLHAAVHPNAKLRVGRTVRLADIFELAVANPSTTSQVIITPGTPSTFQIETRPYSYIRGLELPVPIASVLKLAVAPGQRVPLLGAGSRLSRTPGTWTPEEAGTFTLYFVFDQHEVGKLARRLVSPPLTVTIAP